MRFSNAVLYKSFVKAEYGRHEAWNPAMRMVVTLKIDAMVTSFNRMEYLHDVVEAIATFIPVQKIIIVDGSTYPHSKKTARNVAKTLGAEFYDGPVDIGDKVCIGARKASTEWILVCSDDSIVSRSHWPRVRELILENASFIAPSATHRFLSSCEGRSIPTGSKTVPRSVLEAMS